MALSVEEVRRECRERGKRRLINIAVLHENRLRLHTQAVPSTPALADMEYRHRRGRDVTLTAVQGVGQALDDFLAFAGNLIPHDKFKTFKSLLRFPLKTNEVTAVCFDKLSRVFDGRDPVMTYRFTSREHLGSHPRQGGGLCKAEQRRGDRYPSPYFFFLPISEVVAYGTAGRSSQMEYIIFRQEGGRVAVIDDTSYRLFRFENDEPGELLADMPHGLGYCPARFFWDEPMSLQEYDVKRSPLTRQLDNLDWYLFYVLSKRHLDLYGSYPIYSGYEQNCDFRNDESGDYCDGGFLKDRHGHWRYDGNGLMPCPKCGDRRIVGAGSFIEVPVPIEGQPDLRNPVQMLTVDRNSLDYNVEEEERLRENIITGVVGTNEEVTTRDALNEQQIKANFESQTTVLGRVKKGFESAQKWVDETVCRLRYGAAFVSADIDYGTEFYLSTADELRERYARAKAAGSSEAELEALQRKIIATEYRNDPATLRRMAVLGELEPYAHLTRDEVITLYEKGLVPREDLLVKMNFTEYVSRFERENMDVVEFGRRAREIAGICRGG